MRPTLGYVVIVLPQVGEPSLGSWSKEERRLATGSAVGDLYTSRQAAQRAVQRTMEFSQRKKFGWKLKDFIISRVAGSPPYRFLKAGENR